ncbi:hypothetical protein A2U01_0060433, partial [Trifolium medium]|nr:hypothetical protein [Trifolium medium]
CRFGIAGTLMSEAITIDAHQCRD